LPEWGVGIPATTYGPMNAHGAPGVAAVLHTTETSGMPGYDNGDVAPHYTYDPRVRTFYRHAPFDRYVGTMRGHENGGHANCKAIQCEIIAYSDKSIADQSSSRLWIGDLSDDGYSDLSEWLAMVQAETAVGDDVTPTPAGGWLYGTSAPDRLSESDWWTFSGLTAHGGIPKQKHWDTGVLDLERVANGGAMKTHFYIGDTDEAYEPIVWMLFILEGGTIDPNLNSSQVQSHLPWKTDVRLVQIEDFDTIGALTGMESYTLNRLISDGLYKYGKEVEALHYLYAQARSL